MPTAPAPAAACRARGGVDEERAELARFLAEEQEKERRNFQALQRIREEGFRKVGGAAVGCS